MGHGAQLWGTSHMKLRATYFRIYNFDTFELRATSAVGL